MNNLFSKVEIKNLVLNNRIVMAPLAVKNPEKTGFVNDVVINYYYSMAKLGMGLIITENAFISRESRVMPNQLLISEDKFIDGHRELVKRVHKVGVPITLEINHGGVNIREVPEVKAMLSNKEEAEFVLDDKGESIEIPKSIEEFTQKDLEGIVNLSPITNRRKDKYGGDIKNRMRLLLEVMEEVIEKVGKDYPVAVRFPLSDNPPQMNLYKDGLTVEEGIFVAKELEHIGVDYIDISGGYCGSRPRELKGIEGYYVPYAKLLKDILKIKINVTGGIKTPQFANNVILNNWSDTVGIGRALLSNPNWIKEAKELFT